MTETSTVRDVYVDRDTSTPPSGSWGFSDGLSAVVERTVTPSIGAAVASAWFAVSPVSAFHDPWLVDRRGSVPISLGSTFETVAWRPVSMIEARRVALRNLQRAEERRRKFAEDEAAREIPLEFDA